MFLLVRLSSFIVHRQHQSVYTLNILSKSSTQTSQGHTHAGHAIKSQATCCCGHLPNLLRLSFGQNLEFTSIISSPASINLDPTALALWKPKANPRATGDSKRTCQVSQVVEVLVDELGASRPRSSYPIGFSAPHHFHRRHPAA